MIKSKQSLNKMQKIMATIKPALAGGFKDYLPEEMILRQKMFDAIRSTFELFGFVPLDTPSLEREEILTGGDENFRMNIFRASIRGGEEKLALRFDLTVPLARVIAQYQNEIKRPFKRYQVGKVWRGESPQAGRYREFAQFDADIVGSKSMMADAEIIAIMERTMDALGLQNFIIRINDRKILNGLASYAGFPETDTPMVLRAIDKLDKQGWESVAKELAELGLTPASVSNIDLFLKINGSTQDEILDNLELLMKKSEMGLSGVRELREVAENVCALGVRDKSWTIDLSVARGLGYYTGPVFETVLTDLPSIGSMFSGGRYDDLVSKFSDIQVPATGASVGGDRLFAAMSQLNLFDKQQAITDVMVLDFDPACKIACQKLAGLLRKANIATEIYFGSDSSLKGQLAYAIKQGIPVIAIIGSREMAEGTVQIKDIMNRTQKLTSLKTASMIVKSILAGRR